MISGTGIHMTTTIILTACSVGILPIGLILLYHPPMKSMNLLKLLCLSGFCGFWPFVVRINFCCVVCACVHVHKTFSNRWRFVCVYYA